MSEFEKDFDDDFDEFEDDDFEEEIVTAVDEDGNEKEFIVIDACEVSGTKYILVIDSDCADDEEAEADILKEVSVEGEEAYYSIIDDDEEFEKVAALFSQSEDYDIEL